MKNDRKIFRLVWVKPENYTYLVICDQFDRMTTHTNKMPKNTYQNPANKNVF